MNHESDKYLTLDQLKPDSWQAQQFKKGMRFYGPAPVDPAVIAEADAYYENSVRGKIMINSYTDGSVTRNHGARVLQLLEAA